MAYLFLNARKPYLRRYNFLAYMQVTAAFARKSYLHINNLITPLLISIYTWNLFQNLSFDLFHHDNKRKLFLHLWFSRISVLFFVLKMYFRLEFCYVYSFKEKVNLTTWKILLFINNTNIVEIPEMNQQRTYLIILVAYLHFWVTVKRKKAVFAQIRLFCLHASNCCFCKKVVSIFHLFLTSIHNL